MHVSSDYGFDKIPGYLSIPYDFDPKELMEYYFDTKDKIIEERHIYEKLFYRIKKIKEEFLEEH